MSTLNPASLNPSIHPHELQKPEISIYGELVPDGGKRKSSGCPQPRQEDRSPKHTIFFQLNHCTSSSNHPHCCRASFQTQVRKNCSSFPKLKTKTNKSMLCVNGKLKPQFHRSCAAKKTAFQMLPSASASQEKLGGIEEGNDEVKVFMS